jgi:Periplasmic binding protein
MTADHRQEKSWYLGWITGALCILLLASGAFAAPVAVDQPGAAGLTREETLRLGERIYREGILPSGEPLTAIVEGDIPVEGTMFSCESCHMRAGIGSNEGQVVTLPTNGRKLFQPLTFGRQFTPAEKGQLARNSTKLYEAPHRRPAYTDKTLAAVLRDGIDPAGRILHPVMPRYVLDDRDMAILVYYLKELSSKPSPGVTADTIRFATVIAGDVSPEDRQAMLVPLDSYVRDRNSQAYVYEARAKFRSYNEEMDMAYRKLSLARWELKGPPETWRSQLEDYYRKEPVFALLGGISYGDWQPVHRFCEDHRIPCILPVTDYPVISTTDWYTLYFSKGIYQEGEAAARYIRRMTEQAPAVRVVQVFRDSRSGHALARGVRDTLQDLGQPAPLDIMLKPGEKISRETIKEITGKGNGSVVLLWLGDEAIPLLRELAADPARPGSVFLSSSLLKRHLDNVPPEAREFSFITYPYRLPADEKEHSRIAIKWLESRKAPVNDSRISTRMYSLVRIMSQAFMHLKYYFYRDYFLDVISMFEDQRLADYERLSFGPGQHYASKGCYIVQLGPGEHPALVRKSDWVVH